MKNETCGDLLLLGVKFSCFLDDPGADYQEGDDEEQGRASEDVDDGTKTGVAPVLKFAYQRIDRQ